MPLMFFMGDFRSEHSTVARVETFLDRSKVRIPEASDKNPIIADLLTMGRASDSVYDTKASPLTAFLYDFLGDSQMGDKYQEAENFFLGKLSAEDFLLNQNDDLVDVIATACAQIAYTRRARLLSIRQVLGGKDSRSA